ncbi:hypothetical protein F7725_026878 [Dissostichus mawsoni]|uniref:Uncharacterized protein n=1 Tax=Dissostichus mawsoni TaxID=36200 RepID=A0A7J5X8Q1_DISMA|nr:hypothetical protein F7725_026878 [Dissostichus mawsoni]
MEIFIAQKELWSSPSTCLRALAPCHDIVNVISEAKSSVFGRKGLLPTKHGFKCPEYVTEFKLLVETNGTLNTGAKSSHHTAVKVWELQGEILYCWCFHIESIH